MRRFFRYAHRDGLLQSSRRRWLEDGRLYALNQVLRPVDWALQKVYRDKDLPIVFLVGVPRSGTTLLFQLLCEYLDVGYVNNKMARLFMAPVLAAALHGRHGGGHGLSTHSEYGRTAGDAEPHEFSWFFRRFGALDRYDELLDEEKTPASFAAFCSALQGLVGFIERPLVLKNINTISYQVDFVAELLPQAKFIWVKRDPRYVVQSILEARVHHHGSSEVWWSTRPRNFEQVHDLDPVHQVAFQVKHITGALERDFARLSPEKGIVVHYESIVADPASTLDRLSSWIGTSVRQIPSRDRLGVRTGNRKHFDGQRWSQIEAALDEC